MDSMYAVMPELLKDIDWVIENALFRHTLILDKNTHYYLALWHTRYPSPDVVVSTVGRALCIDRYKGLYVEVRDIDHTYITVGISGVD